MEPSVCSCSCECVRVNWLKWPAADVPGAELWRSTEGHQLLFVHFAFRPPLRLCRLCRLGGCSLYLVGSCSYFVSFLLLGSLRVELLFSFVRQFIACLALLIFCSLWAVPFLGPKIVYIYVFLALFFSVHHPSQPTLYYFFFVVDPNLAVQFPWLPLMCGGCLVVLLLFFVFPVAW